MAGREEPAFSEQRIKALNERERVSYLARVLMKSDPRHPHTQPILAYFAAAALDSRAFAEKLRDVSGEMTPAKWAKIAALMRQQRFKLGNILGSINGMSSGANALHAMKIAGFPPQERATALKETGWHKGSTVGQLLHEGGHSPAEAVEVMDQLGMSEHEIGEQLEATGVGEEEIKQAMRVFRTPPPSSFLRKVRGSIGNRGK